MKGKHLSNVSSLIRQCCILLLLLINQQYSCTYALKIEFNSRNNKMCRQNMLITFLIFPKGPLLAMLALKALSTSPEKPR